MFVIMTPEYSPHCFVAWKPYLYINYNIKLILLKQTNNDDDGYTAVAAVAAAEEEDDDVAND